MLDLDAYRKRKRIKELKLPPVVGHLKLAEEFQRLLHTEEARNRAGVARRFGLTRARVTQLLQLLQLHPAILGFVRELPRGTPERLITEKKLRQLARLAPDLQLEKARRMLSGFGGYEVEHRRAAS